MRNGVYGRIGKDVTKKSLRIASRWHGGVHQSKKRLT